VQWECHRAARSMGGESGDGPIAERQIRKRIEDQQTIA
jgi:hypothetical protein